MSIAAVVAWLWLSHGCFEFKRLDGKTVARPIACVDAIPLAPSASDDEFSGGGFPGDGFWSRKAVNTGDPKREHVIEIRTRRGIPSAKCVQQLKEVLPAWTPEVAELALKKCTSKTREVYIDGQRWGVLRESEGK